MKLLKRFGDPLARRQLARGIRVILELSPAELKDYRILANIIRGIGLRHDRRHKDLYGDDAKHMNLTNNGLWQIPDQLAKAMVILSEHNIDTFLEVGTHTGYTFSVLAAYLYRLNSGLQALTIDPHNSFHHYSTVRKFIPVEFRNITSKELKGSVYDCVLIDGNHSYGAVAEDFENVGRHARLCMFHDINDYFVGPDSVPKFWGELVRSGAFAATHEVLDCPEGKKAMGIGIGIKAGKDGPSR